MAASKVGTAMTHKNVIKVTSADSYLVKVNNENQRTRCDVFSKLTIKTAVINVNFEKLDIG